MPYSGSHSEKRSKKRAWYHRTKKLRDPNIHRWECLRWYERRADEKRRWLRHLADLGLSIGMERPTYYIRNPSGTLTVEVWETVPEMVKRLEKKGALMTPKNPENPRQREIDAETAREILRGCAIDKGEEATREEVEIQLRVQMLLLSGGERRPLTPEVEALVDRCLASYWQHVDAMYTLQELAQKEFQKEGYVHVLEEKH